MADTVGGKVSLPASARVTPVALLHQNHAELSLHMAGTLGRSKHTAFFSSFFLVIFADLHLAFCVTHVRQRLQIQERQITK